MGKSPGKWIKGILFGKKTSKSNASNGRELSRSASEKPSRVSSKEPISMSIDDTPLISDPVPDTIVDRIDNSSFDKGETAILGSVGLVYSSKENGDKPLDPGQANDPEKTELCQAATVVQASIRSYQARSEFQTLKSIIRLQAAIRGCLVRRQAIATLFCVQGIVKFQAITRGYIVRQSRIGNGECRKQCLVAEDTGNQGSCETKYRSTDTMLKNAFMDVLLSSSPIAMPLRIQYSTEEPNSAWSWLSRWSISQVWAPSSKQKEIGVLQLQAVETEQSKPKRKDRGVLSATVRDKPNHANDEMEKLEHKGRKSSSQSIKSIKDNPQFGHEKVKRGLKKIQKPSGEISNEAEVNVDKPRRYQKMPSKSPAPKLSENTPNAPVDNPMADFPEAAEQNGVESSLELQIAGSPANQLTSHVALVEDLMLVSEKSQDILALAEDSKDDQISSKNCKSSRKTSLPIKHDDPQATPENVTKVPSYMTTTASSKAKVKVHVSPRFGQDVVDNNGLTRRHSLPPSINGKLISSPRVHGLVQANGREGIKIDRSLSSSRDVADKAIHVDWKR